MREVIAEIARRHALEFVALFGSTAREGSGRDLDLAVMPRDVLDEKTDREALYLELAAAVAPQPLDLAWMPTASWLLHWQVARDGIAWVQERPGSFARFREAGYWRQVDSDRWRQAERTYLSRFLGGDTRLDRDLITKKLVLMTKYLAELEFVATHSREQFEENPLLLRTAERDTELLVEAAARINTEIGQSKSIPPTDYYSSFFALIPDWLDRDTATGLAAAARLRNLLVHQYDDIHPHQVHEHVVKTAPLWRAYLAAINSKL